MENNEIKQFLDCLSAVYDLGYNRSVENGILNKYKVSIGSFIEHTSIKYKGIIGIVVGTLNDHLNIIYLNSEHDGYELDDKFKKINKHKLINTLKDDKQK
jgi:hypothetical protein